MSRRRGGGGTCAVWMSATLPSQSIFVVGSSGRAVAQSMTVWMPTNAAGSDDGSFRSAYARARHVIAERLVKINELQCDGNLERAIWSKCG